MMTNESTHEGTHDQTREALEALALDALDASERRAVLAHLSTCASCREELRTLELTVRDLAYAARPIAMAPAQRDRVRARLLARAAADASARGANAAGGARDVTASPAPMIIPLRQPSRGQQQSQQSQQSQRQQDQQRSTPRTVQRGGRGGWMALAAGIVAVASLAQLARVSAERDSLRDAVRTATIDRGSRAVAMDSLKGVVAERDRELANLTGSQVAVMTLASATPSAPSARMFWDQSVNAWTFVAHNLPAPRAGRTYQLWLVTPTAKISAGTFAPGATGDAVVRATYALARDSLAAVAVTDEPTSGSAQPTTTPFMVAVNRPGK